MVRLCLAACNGFPTKTLSVFVVNSEYPVLLSSSSSSSTVVLFDENPQVILFSSIIWDFKNPLLDDRNPIADYGLRFSFLSVGLEFLTALTIKSSSSGSFNIAPIASFAISRSVSSENPNFLNLSKRKD